MVARGEAEKILRAPADLAKGGTAPDTHGFKILATDGYLAWFAPDPSTGALIRRWQAEPDGGMASARDYLLNALRVDLLPSWQKGRVLADKYGLAFQVGDGGRVVVFLVH